METVMVIQKSPTTPVVQQTPRTLYKEPQQLVKQQTTRKSQAHLEVQTSNVQTELLAVNEIVSRVDQAFKAREQEKNQLVEIVQEKEKELKYCEDETRKQAEELSILCASVAFRKRSLQKLTGNFTKFATDKAEPLTKRGFEYKAAVEAWIECIEAMTADLQSLQQRKDKQKIEVGDLQTVMEKVEMHIQKKKIHLLEVNKSLMKERSETAAIIKNIEEEMTLTNELAVQLQVHESERFEKSQEKESVQRSYESAREMVKSAQERLDGCHSTAADIATQQRQEFSEMELELDNAKAALKEQQQLLQSHEMQIEAIQSELDVAHKETERIHNLLVQSKEVTEKLTTNRQQLQETSEAVQGNLTRITEEVHEEQATLTATRSAGAAADRHTEASLRLITERADAIREIQKKEPDLRYELLVLQGELEKRKTDGLCELKLCEETLSALQAQLELLQSETAEASESSVSLKQQLDNNQKDLVQLRDQSAVLEDEVTQLTLAEADLQSSIASRDETARLLAATTTTNDELSKAALSLQEDILVVEEQCRALDAEVATLKAAIATKTVWTPDMLTEDAMAKLEQLIRDSSNHAEDAAILAVQKDIKVATMRTQQLQAGFPAKTASWKSELATLATVLAGAKGACENETVAVRTLTDQVTTYDRECKLLEEKISAREAILREEARLRAQTIESARRLAEEERQRLQELAVAREQAEQHARMRAAEEARVKAVEEARLKALEEARLEAVEEARLKALEEARLKAVEVARLKALEEARLEAVEEARLEAVEEARLIAVEEARLKAAEEARLKALEEARLKAAEVARLKATEVARLKAVEEARLIAVEEARLNAAEEARLKAAEEARVKAAEQVRLEAKREARIKAAQDIEADQRVAEKSAREQKHEQDRMAKASVSSGKVETGKRMKVREKSTDDLKGLSQTEIVSTTVTREATAAAGEDRVTGEGDGRDKRPRVAAPVHVHQFGRSSKRAAEELSASIRSANARPSAARDENDIDEDIHIDDPRKNSRLHDVSNYSVESISGAYTLSAEVDMHGSGQKNARNMNTNSPENSADKFDPNDEWDVQSDISGFSMFFDDNSMAPHAVSLNVTNSTSAVHVHRTETKSMGASVTSRKTYNKHQQDHQQQLQVQPQTHAQQDYRKRSVESLTSYNPSVAALSVYQPPANTTMTNRGKTTTVMSMSERTAQPAASIHAAAPPLIAPRGQEAAEGGEFPRHIMTTEELRAAMPPPPKMPARPKKIIKGPGPSSMKLNAGATMTPRVGTGAGPEATLAARTGAAARAIEEERFLHVAGVRSTTAVTAAAAGKKPRVRALPGLDDWSIDDMFS